MKLFKKMKAGGLESTVTGYWLIESKSLFSVCLLKFEGNSRNVFHTHAFNCISWLIKGSLTETFIEGSIKTYKPSWKPFKTTREDFYKVDSRDKHGTVFSWVLTFRGPWNKTWEEFDPKTGKFITLTNGRNIV